MTKVRLGTAGVLWCRVTVRDNCVSLVLPKKLHHYLVQSIEICLENHSKVKPNNWLNYDGNKQTLLKLGVVRENCERVFGD